MSFGARTRAERGQAMVEFALTLPLLLLVIVGIFEFGKTINYWIDQNQLASEGARWVVVNKVPDPTTTPCGNGIVVGPSVTSYKNYIRCQAETQELKDLASIRVCLPSGASAPGNPVKVRLTSNYTMFPILSIGTVTINSTATMRLEQQQTAAVGTFDAAAQC